MIRLKHPYTTFQESSITFKKCKGCKQDCQLLYDHHHDQHFSYTCGRVILQSNTYETNYTTDPYYWEKEYARRREIVQLKKIMSQLKELHLKKTKLNLENRTITIHDPLDEDHQYLITRSCRDTVFELTSIETHHIIQKEKITGNKKGG